LSVVTILFTKTSFEIIYDTLTDQVSLNIEFLKYDFIYKPMSFDKVFHYILFYGHDSDFKNVSNQITFLFRCPKIT